MYSSCVKEFSTDCLMHVALTLSWPHSLIFEVKHVKFHVISLVYQRDEILLFATFQSQPCLASFVLGKIKQKLQMIRQKCFPLSKNLVHLGGGGLLCHHWYQLPCSPMGSPLLFAGPAGSRLASPELLGFFCKQKRLEYKNETCDLLGWSEKEEVI